MTTSLRYAARSDVGLVRTQNQDSGYAGPHLMVLCDGMGGPAGGDIASAVAVYRLIDLDADSHQAGDMLGLLREAVQDAHTQLTTLSASNPDLAGLGTTCIALMRSGNKLAMVHVGDSRAYLLRDGELTQVTTDHTFVEYLVETGRLTRDQARRHPQRSVLLRVLGDAEGEVQLDESIREAVPGDRWLLCSDGLYGPVSAETITEVLSSVPDPGGACDQLIDLALRGGGPDNITAVVFDVVDDDSEPQTEPQMVGSAANRRARRGDTDDTSDLSGPPSASTPAARAAALVAAASPTEPLETSEDKALAAQAQAERERHRIRGRRSLIGALLLVIAVVGSLFMAYQWTQTHYYISTADGRVAIYQGIPQKLGPVSLSHVVEVFDTPALDQLDSRMQHRLAETVGVHSLQEARSYVHDTVATHVVPTTPTESPATPSATPTASASAGPSTAPPATQASRATASPSADAGR